MKKMMILACLIFSAAAFTAMAADVAKIQSTNNTDMVAELAGMTNADDWCDYLNSVIENGDDALIKRVIVNAQSALNSLDDDAAANVAKAIDEKVAEVAVARYLTGKYALAYVGSVNSDGKIVTNNNVIGIGDNVGEEDLSGVEGTLLKSNTIGKGIGVSSSDEEKDPYHPEPVPPVSGQASRF